MQRAGPSEASLVGRRAPPPPPRVLVVVLIFSWEDRSRVGSGPIPVTSVYLHWPFRDTASSVVTFGGPEVRAST